MGLDIIQLVSTYFALSVPTIVLCIVLITIALNPEKIEKWVALLWQAIDQLGAFAKFANKRYVQHDLQGRVNGFVRRLKHKMPSLDNSKIAIEWIAPEEDRKAFFTGDRVVIRLRRDDPNHHNFIHATYLFVSESLLRTAK